MGPVFYSWPDCIADSAKRKQWLYCVWWCFSHSSVHQIKKLVMQYLLSGQNDIFQLLRLPQTSPEWPTWNKGASPSNHFIFEQKHDIAFRALLGRHLRNSQPTSHSASCSWPYLTRLGSKACKSTLLQKSASCVQWFIQMSSLLPDFTCLDSPPTVHTNTPVIFFKCTCVLLLWYLFN